MVDPPLPFEAVFALADFGWPPKMPRAKINKTAFFRNCLLFITTSQADADNGIANKDTDLHGLKGQPWAHLFYQPFGYDTVRRTLSHRAWLRALAAD
jgi:hypothetical protein